MTRQLVGRAVGTVWAALVVGTPMVASAQSSPNQDALAALLIEVRALRVAMEQMASAGPRIQIAFGRLQLQEARVQALVRRHTDAREQLASAEREADMFAAQVDTMQEEARQSTDTNRRRDLERELPHLKARQEQLANEVQRLRALEIDLAQQVASEQNRWIELSGALDQLERALRR